MKRFKLEIETVNDAFQGSVLRCHRHLGGS